MCQKLYYQKCLKPCVEDEVRHDHERSCCSKFKGLIRIMKDWGEDAGQYPDIDNCLLTKAALVFVFGNHVLYSIKYFQFFKKNKIIEDDCTHGLFMYVNLIANIFFIVLCIVLLFSNFSFYCFFRLFSLNAILNSLCIIGSLCLNSRWMNHLLRNSLLEEEGMIYINSVDFWIFWKKILFYSRKYIFYFRLKFVILI